jgi:hypothetical protein
MFKGVESARMVVFGSRVLFHEWDLNELVLFQRPLLMWIVRCVACAAEIRNNVFFQYFSPLNSFFDIYFVSAWSEDAKLSMVLNIGEFGVATCFLDTRSPEQTIQADEHVNTGTY